MKKSGNEHGSVLLLSMTAVVVVAGMVAAAHFATSGQSSLTARSADMDALATTAEGVLDYGYGAWKTAMMTSTTGDLTTTQSNALISGNKRPALPDTMSYVSFTITAVDAYGTAVENPTLVFGLSDNPPGWQASTYNYVARVTLRSSAPGGVRQVTLQRTMRHDLIPPVGGIFFTEGDFELYKPAPMTIGGNVHTNGNGYVSTHYSDTASKLRFLSTASISHIGSYGTSPPPGATLWSAAGSSDTQTPIYDRGTSQITKTDRIEGIGIGTSAVFNTTDANPNNDGNRELIEPPVAGFSDPPEIASSRIYNNAGIVVEIQGPINTAVAATSAGSGVFVGNNVKVIAKNGAVLNTTKATQIIQSLANTKTVMVPEYKYVYNSSTKKYEWKWVDVATVVQNTMYDKREKGDVTIADVNFTNLNPVLNGVSGFNNILYIHNSSSEPTTAIKLLNGGILPTNGLTLATDGGLYVKGDYNTGTLTPSEVPSNVTGSAATAQPHKTGTTTKPAALVGDAVMVLSNSWSDANATKTVSNRVASHTTINSAIIAGYIPSQWKNPATNETYWYSGGMNNFPRFLETWASKNMTYYGAFVQLFQSKAFVGEWDTGDIYAPPNRRWNFDQLLLSRVIPGIPPASAFSRGRLRPLFL